MNKNIIFTRCFHINPEPRLEKAAKWIKEMDKSINISAIGWDRECKNLKKEIRDGILIQRVWFRGEYGKGIQRNLIGVALFNIYLMWILFTRKVDVVHACDLDTAIPAFIISRIKNIKIVYDIYDFYSDNRKLGILDIPIRKLEKKIARYSDVVIIADERRLDQVLDNEEQDKTKIITIYNTPNDVKISVYKEKYLVAYVGVLNRDRKILETAKLVCELEDEKMICAGYGVLQEELLNLSLKHSNLIFKGQVSYDVALQMEGSAKVILAMYDPKLPNNKYAAPNKLCEAMMLGKAIITSKGTLCADIVEKERIGFSIDFDDLKELRKILNYIRKNDEEIKTMGRRARKLYDTKYSANLSKMRLQKKYKEILG